MLFRESHVKYLNTYCKFIFWFKMNKSLFNVGEDIYFGAVIISSKERKILSPDFYFKFEEKFIRISRECKYMYDKILQLES